MMVRPACEPSPTLYLTAPSSRACRADEMPRRRFASRQAERSNAATKDDTARQSIYASAALIYFEMPTLFRRTIRRLLS